MNKALLYSLSLFWIVCVIPATHADQHANSGVDFNRLIRQAELANASYASADRIQHILDKYLIRLDFHGLLKESQIGFFLATDDARKTQTIVVRGTSNIENILVNISVELVVDEPTGLLLHRGYADTARKIIAALGPLLKKDYAIHTAGHSLGGAIALIAAVLLDHRGYEVRQVVTFGQPKVANIAASAKMQHLNLVRVTTATDPVPLLPLLDPLDINNLRIYWHAGRELLLLDGDRYAIINGTTSMLRTTDISLQSINDEGLHQHRMQAYLDQLKMRRLQSERVDYRPAFKLFDFFTQ